MSFTPQSASVDAGTGLDVAALPDGSGRHKQIMVPAEAKDGAAAPLTHDDTEAYASGLHGTILLTKRQDAQGPIAGADGRLTPLQTDAQGALLVAPRSGVAQPVVGGAAHDATANNPVGIGGRANATEPAEVSADGDLVHAWLDRKGRLVLVSEHPPAEPSSGAHGPVSVNATASGTTTVIAAPAAGQSIHVTSVLLSNQGAAKVRASLRAGTGGADRLRGTLAADGGGLREGYAPAWKLPAATALVVNLGAAGDVDVNVHFYVAP